MKTQRHRKIASWPMIATGILGAALPALAGDDPTFSYNRFNVGARFFFNISAEVNNLPVAANAGPTYDDGFVATDVSGNAGGQTWNWGYSADNQLVGGNLELHSMTSPRDGLASTVSDDPEWGFDISYGRVLGRFDMGSRKAAWGLEAGFSSTDIEIRGNDTVSGNVARQSYQFALNPAVLYPQAPYAGTFNGPGTLVGAVPGVPAPTQVLAASSQHTQIDGLFYGLRVGPFLEIPIMNRLALTVAGGGAVVHAEADVTVNESIDLPAGSIGLPLPARTFKESNDEFLFGVYGEARLSFDVTEFTSIYIGGQYQFLDDFGIAAGSKLVTMKLSESYAAIAGLSFKF
jgi:hypothetical protein